MWLLCAAKVPGQLTVTKGCCIMLQYDPEPKNLSSRITEGHDVVVGCCWRLLVPSLQNHVSPVHEKLIHPWSPLSERIPIPGSQS